jgi:TonB family protein
MKDKDKHYNHKKNFIKIPTYPGGKQAFIDFIHRNLKYPEQALTNKIEGFVHLSYEVNNLGEIVSVHVKKGLGYGCDEEAVRLISLLKYEAVRNRGIKMKAEIKARIKFTLPAPEPIEDDNPLPEAAPMQINYNYTSSSEQKKEPDNSNQTHLYTINY